MTPGCAWILASLISLAHLAALPPSLSQDALTAERQRLVGLWEAQTGPARQLRIRLQLDPDGRVVLLLPTAVQAGFRAVSGKYQIDPESNPRRMTWTGLTYERRRLPDNPAIYSLSRDGNRLSIVCGMPDGRRPERFPDDPLERASRVLEFYRMSEPADRPDGDSP